MKKEAKPKKKVWHKTRGPKPGTNVRKAKAEREAEKEPEFTSVEEELAWLDKKEEELQRALLAEEMKLEQYISTHRTEYFQPFPHQERFYQHVRDNKKTCLLVGANRIGKTIACVNLIAAFMNGCKQPWDEGRIYPSDRAKEADGKGVIGRILCKDWEKSAKDTIVPALKEWLPVGTYETKKNSVGVEYEWTFPKTKSKLTICTYNEDTKSQEGWKGDFVHADEPPPRDKYIANRRGLVDYNGVFTMAMTAISEPWILDEIVENPDPSTGIVADIPITANTSLSPEAIRIYESGLTEDEKIARIQGGWLQLTGRVWKMFDQRIHVVEPFKIPPDWPVQFQIDFHLTVPHAISFVACDKYNRFFACSEVWENCSSEQLADEIIKLKLANTWRLTYGEVDALSKGDTSYIKNRLGAAEDSYTIIERKLRKYGIRLGVGSKDEKSYIKAVETRLKGVNGMPTLFIFNTCKETIKQVQRWAYDDNGKPKDDGHFPECLGRFTQTGLKYTDPHQWSRPLQMAAHPL